MSDNEIEDVSFLPGESLHRKARYEPNIVQQIRLLFCTRRRAISLALVGGLLVLVIAILVTVSHCSCPASNGPPTTQESTPQTLTPNYTATNGQPFPYKSLRLPKSVTPTHYSLFLHPNISESWFRGHINISCKIISNTDFIVVHSKDLNISDISIINGEDGHRLPVTLWLEYKTNEQIYVELGASVSRGSTVILTVVFEGKLVKKLAGFYKSSYKTKLGETREIATTHFEPTDARAAFPCFDEPELKGTFELRMVRDLHDVALFNMPLLSSTNYTGNLRLDQFQTSVKMSTYLVAFIVCDYKQITNKTQSNITVSVYAPDDFINSAQFALDTAVKVLDYYEQFFKVKYPLPKQDLIAIPDFEAGAMENWGLITYRLTAVLYDPTMSSAHNQQWVAVVIAHELAHQWFGNLVTMEWWDDLWLNEGFACFVEYIGSSVVDETWKMKDQFVYESLLSSLRLDSLTNSHPINLPVENPNQINELFDTITYDKGASIIRMLSNFMGDDIFNDGLTSYLNTYRFSNAATTDLWSSLQQAVVDKKRNLGTDVGRMMRTWTEQMGYPVITLTRTRSKVTVTQSRFLLYKSENTSEDFTSPFGYRWEVPFTYSTSEDHQTVHKMLLKDAQDSFEITKNTSWIKGNCGRYGFYRVNYDEAGWNATIQQLNIEHQVFTIVERAGLIDDAFALARAGLLKYNTALQLTEYMVHEKDYLPWATLLENLGYIQNRIENKPVYSNYKQYILKLIKGQLDNTVWEDKGTHLEKYLRAAILSKAVHLGHKQSIEKGRQLFEQWKHNHSSINVNLKTVIYLAGIEYGTEDDWETVWRAYQSEMDASEKRKLLSVLGFSRDARLLSRLLDYSIDGNMVKPQDTASVISMVTNNLAGEILAWRFVQQHWNLFYKGYAGSSFTMSRIIKSVSGGFDTQFDLDQVQLFFKDRDAGSGKRAVKQSIEKIGINIDWLAKYEHEITDWFMRHGQ